MHELGHALRSLGAVIALVQEPYTVGGLVRGLPAGMRVFTDVQGDASVDCTVVSRSE